MRQHPIPQNILDVEFKLFTKFTIKEFAYLAIGIGFGGVFLYLSARGTVPGIIGIPVFVLCSAAGIFLGLVPINDQDADVFVKNYITAITNPTQRVWMNKDMQESRTKPNVKPTDDGAIINKDAKENKKKIIGSNILTEESKQEDSSFKEKVPAQQTTKQKIDKNPNTEGSIPQVEEQAPVATPTPKPLDGNLVQINENNLENYQVDIKSLDQLPGNINIWICTPELKQIPNVITYLRDNTGKVLYANKTGPNGYFLTNKVWPEGIYTVEFQHPQFKFPKVQLVITENFEKKPIKITALI